jgi:hypothetical protein
MINTQRAKKEKTFTSPYSEADESNSLSRFEDLFIHCPSIDI